MNFFRYLALFIGLVTYGVSAMSIENKLEAEEPFDPSFGKDLVKMYSDELFLNELDAGKLKNFEFFFF